MRKLFLLLFTFSTLVGCAALGAGEDPVLVRAQQTYETATNTLKLVLTIEDQNEAVIEAKFPGSHKIAERIRVEQREVMPRLFDAINKYETMKEAGLPELNIALAMVESLLRDAQDLLTKAERAKPQASLTVLMEVA